MRISFVGTVYGKFTNLAVRVFYGAHLPLLLDVDPHGRGQAEVCRLIQPPRHSRLGLPFIFSIFSQLSVRRRRSCEIRCQPPDALGEELGLGEKRENEEILGRKVEKIAGMDEHSSLIKEIQNQLLVVDRAADAKHGRPTPPRFQELGR